MHIRSFFLVAPTLVSSSIHKGEKLPKNAMAFSELAKRHQDDEGGSNGGSAYRSGARPAQPRSGGAAEADFRAFGGSGNTLSAAAAPVSAREARERAVKAAEERMRGGGHVAVDAKQTARDAVKAAQEAYDTADEETLALRTRATTQGISEEEQIQASIDAIAAQDKVDRLYAVFEKAVNELEKLEKA